MPLRDDLLNPIPGDSPSGENVRYAPVYDQIREARREEEDVAQGEWQTELKKADWVVVVKLAGETLAKKSKDLQIAAWLTEAITRREGFGGLKAGLELLRGLVEQFWDTLYPEIDEGDLGLRATPLDWLGSRMDQTIKRVPLTRSGRDWFAYKESRTVPYEADTADNENKQQARATALEEHKLTPEEFDGDFGLTPMAFYQQAEADLDGCLEAVGTLNGICEEKFGDDSPSFAPLRKTLEEVRQTVHVLLVKNL
jgi:type VI secretion system protein ImpA